MDFAARRVSTRADLNRLLLECFTSISSCPNAEFFKSSVDVLSDLTDYLSFVDAEDAVMSLDLIHSRCKSCYYTSCAAFKSDFELIQANSAAYNSPGCGVKANSDLINWAAGLIKACEDQTEARRPCFDKLAVASKELMQEQSDQAEGSNNGGKSASVLSGLEALVAACDLETVGHQGSPQANAPLQSKMMPRTVPGSDKHRRHKSKVKVWIRSNKVIYLPTSFMEDNFDPELVPVTCNLLVEADGLEQPGRHEVTIKSVPRQGLSTMYCMTSVLKFQSSFLNWAVVGWTRVDSQTIKIHLQTQPQGLLGDSARDEEGVHVHVPPHHPSEAKHVKRKNPSDSANDEKEGNGDEEEGHERKQSHRGSPKSQRITFKPSQPVLSSQDVELSPANSEGELDIPNPLAPSLGSFPPFGASALFPFGASAFLNPFPTSASMAQLGPTPTLAWQMLMGGPFAFPLGCIPPQINPLMMAASDPLVTMRSSEEPQAIAAKKKSKS